MGESERKSLKQLTNAQMRYEALVSEVERSCKLYDAVLKRIEEIQLQERPSGRE
jgi:uncharacterized protein involved in exopolysaccharide biosynthesis